MGNGYGEDLTADRKLLVTVVMPCLNEERRIVGALESLVDDWLPAEGEVLVMDGGSVDSTRRLVAEFAERRGRTGAAVGGKRGASPEGQEAGTMRALPLFLS
jgi:hypothetical protein